MGEVRYSALVRTLNSEKTLPATLECLANQTIAPSEYVFVDSGSTDRTLNVLPHGSKIHKFVGHEFNHAAALNQGICHVSTSYVLIISSHTLLIKRDAVKFALDILEAHGRIGAAYFVNNFGPLQYTVVDESCFNGWNGLWSTCALIRVDLLRRRGFRPEVFTAEDQEWASWLFSHGKATARISGAGNVNISPSGHYLKKYRNEYVSIAYF